MEPTKASTSPSGSLNDHGNNAAVPTPHDASSQGSTKVPLTGRNWNDNEPIDDEKAALEKEAMVNEEHHQAPVVDDEKTNGFHVPAEAFAPSADKDSATSQDNSRMSKDVVLNEKKTAEETTTSVVEPPVTVDNDAANYPSGTALTLLTIGLCLATFVVALDNTIIGKPRSTYCYRTVAKTHFSDRNP